MLILQVVALTVVMAAGQAPAASSKDERVAAAYQQFEKQRHVEAALEFEALWRDFKEPRFLFNAAVTRYTARHYAHAVAYLNEYLALAEVTGSDREEAKAQLEVAQREVASVQVKVQAGGVAGPVGLTAQRVSELASDLRPPLPVKLAATAGGQGGVIQLDPGTWTLRAEAPGAEPAEVQVKVTIGAPLTVELALRPMPQETGPKGHGVVDAGRTIDARKAAFATLGAGAGLAVGGVVITAIGQALKFGPAVAAPSSECTGDGALIACSVAVRRGLLLRSAGSAVLGAGVGVAASSVGWLVRRERSRRTAWGVQLGLGGAALIGGVVGMVVGTRGVDDVNKTFQATDAATWEAIQGGVKSPAALYTAGTALVGLGAGLATGAALGLGLGGRSPSGADSPVARSLRVGGAAAPGVAGLSLAGRF